MNYLEQLVAEWYEYQGYYVRRNVKVGKRSAGGWNGELDVVAFHPENKHILHVEPSMDAHSWSKREGRYKKKFAAGKRHIPELFKGLRAPGKIDQVALFGYGGKGPNPNSFAGGRVMLAKELLAEISNDLMNKRVTSEAVPQTYPLLRTIQYMLDSHSGLGCTFD